MDEYISESLVDKFCIPHVFFPQDTIQQEKHLAWHINGLSGEELLLASAIAFSYEGILAGVTMDQLEFFAKNASVNQRKELADSFLKKNRIEKVMQIAHLMDDDIGSSSTKNITRIKDLIQYVSDNWLAFQK